MLRAGDIIEVQNRTPSRGLIVRLEGDQARGLDIHQQPFEVKATADEVGDCQVVAHPVVDWPFVQLPTASRPLVLPSVGRPTRDQIEVLEYLVDWYLAEPLRRGGALYLNPELWLRPQERLLLTFGEQTVGIVIPRHFGTLAQRVKRASPPPPPKPKSLFARLVEDNEDEDE